MELALARSTSPVSHDHVVQFYENEQFLVASVAGFLATGLREGQPVLVIATDAHRQAFLRSLKHSHDINVHAALQSGQLTCLDAAATLSQMMVDGMPDAALVRQHVGGVLEQILTAHDGARVRVYGEMVDLLWRGNNAHAAIRLEELWNELAQAHAFSLLCAYDVSSFGRSSSTLGVRDVCAVHGHAIPAESYSERWSDKERRQAAMDLQLRGATLAIEVDQRRALERALRRALAARRAAEKDRAGLQSEAAAARARLERNEQATTEWLVQKVHDLRTPLNAILGWAQLAAMTPADPAALSKALEVIERNAEALNRLIDGLLEPRRDGVGPDV